MLAGACGDSPSLDETVAKASDTSAGATARCDAVADLTDFGTDAIVPLHALATSRNERVALCAVKALARMHGPQAVRSLASLLDTRDVAVALSAATALGRKGDPAAVRPLVAALDSESRSMVTTVLEALGRIGDPRAIPPIGRLALHHGATPAADRQARPVRAAAVAALGAIGDPRAKATLVTVLGAQTSESDAAAVALVRIFRKDVSPLLPLLGDARNVALAYTLVDLGQKGTEDALVSALMVYGDVELAEYYLNCGNGRLEKAAHTWAGMHGYSVYTTPGYGGEQWGSGV